MENGQGGDGREGRETCEMVRNGRGGARSAVGSTFASTSDSMVGMARLCTDRT